MSPLDASQATPASSSEEFDRWLRDHGASETERIVAICFVPRRPGSNWSAANRERVRRLQREGRMTRAGEAVLPPDL